MHGWITHRNTHRRVCVCSRVRTFVRMLAVPPTGAESAQLLFAIAADGLTSKK